MTTRTSPAVRRVATIALGLCVAFSVGCGGRIRSANVDKEFAQWARADSPGAAVVIVQDGAVIHQKGYGYANLEHRVPITPQTRFDVASVAKQFTGLAVAMLVHEGKLSLEDDIRKHLPDVPDFGSPITIGHLVHHTGGLRDWPETLGLAGFDRQGPITQEAILEMVRRQRELDFPPGERHSYSNTGYNLLAAAVARVTGQSFRAWSETHLFQPLGMKNTFVCDNPAEVVANGASSYVSTAQGKFQHVSSQLSAQGSSSIFASAEDMGRWLLNFETARIGGKPAIAMMHQPGKLNHGGKMDYAFGVRVAANRGVGTVIHTGSWAGYRSVALRIPEKRFAVAILANAGNMDTQRLAFRIAEIYGALPPGKPSEKTPGPPAVAFKADPATWDPFLGTYRLGPGWLLAITREDGSLMARATRESKFKMTPISDRSFFVEGYGSSVEFVGEGAGSGSVTHLLYRGIKAPKLVLPEMTPVRLADYVGDYWSEELRVMSRIEIHDGKLATRARSGNWIHFVPTGIDRFDPEGAEMMLEFTRNPAAEVNELKRSGGRIRNIRYTRVTLPASVPAESPPARTTQE